METTIVPCPRCGLPLAPAGTIEAGGRDRPVFACDACTTVAEVFGEPFEVALTFALDDRGRPFDPAAAPGEPPAWAAPGAN